MDFSGFQAPFKSGAVNPGCTLESLFKKKKKFSVQAFLAKVLIDLVWGELQALVHFLWSPGD